MAENTDKNQSELSDNVTEKDNINAQLEKFQLQSQQQTPPNRAKLSLPLRSVTLNQTSTEAFADLKSQQLIQSSSFESVTNVISSTTDSISSTNNLTSNAIKRQNFKTKRFYESEDHSILMPALFSQTIRSPSVTPTDDIEIANILAADILPDNTITTSTTISSNQIMDINTINKTSITPIVTPTSPLPSNNQQEILDSLTVDIENLSAAEYSNAESQTDNIEMYNDPNMSSIIDNVIDECDDVIKDIDEDVISDNNKLPAIKPTQSNAVRMGGMIRRPSIVVELYTDNAVKSEECKIDGECGYVSPPLWKTILQPTIPTAGISYFDTTIEEDEEEIFYNDDNDDNSTEYNIPLGTIKNKSTNTEIPFDCKDTRPVKEAAGLISTNQQENNENDKSDNNKPKEESKNVDETINSTNDNIDNENKTDTVSSIDQQHQQQQDDDNTKQNETIDENKDCEIKLMKEDEDYDESDDDEDDDYGSDEENADDADDDDDSDDDNIIIVHGCQAAMENEATKTTIVSKTKKIISKKAVSSASSSTILSSGPASPADSAITLTMSECVGLEKIKSSSSSTKTGYGGCIESTMASTSTALSKIKQTSSIDSKMQSISTETDNSIGLIDKNKNSSSTTSAATTTATSSTSGKKKTRKSKKSESEKETAMLTHNKINTDESLVVLSIKKNTKLLKTTTNNSVITNNNFMCDNSNLLNDNDNNKKLLTKCDICLNKTINLCNICLSLNSKRRIIPSNIALHMDNLLNINVKNLKKIYLTEKLSTNWKSKDHQARMIKINRDVSVKHLCRSFGDLTQILTSDSSYNTNLKRAKSFNDVGRNDASKLIQTGVSVRALRDSYCSLVGMGSDCNINRADYPSKKSSFSKFDALQKKNILHVRSSDSGKAQEKFGDKIENEQNCRACNKVVYKMEEMKAEKNIWHRNCFKCVECGKLLNVDTYQSHESILYCKPHFKLLFAPKAVEDTEPAKPRKPELIIRENQPEELPPDVVRASDKPDLGLEELHQLNVKSRFQVFENYQEQGEQQANSIERSPSGVKRSASILSKLAKFQAKGLHTGVSDDALNGITYEQSSTEEEEEDDIPDGEDADLIRAKRAQRERPMSFSNMNDIKTKFESGHVMTKEERREERKQEIQNIRSRLFMGKQARIKEMYQQAVAESEQGITSSSKKPEIEIGDKARSLKEKFEKGEISNREDDETENISSKVHEEDVFEQGISKKSRSIFMELDASASKSPQSPMPATPRTPDIKKLSQVSPLQVDKLKPFPTENVVKCDEKQDDIKIETSEISSKFKFFETYKPSENKKKEFRITPPREGVVKMPSPDREVYVDPTVIRSEEKVDDPNVAEQTHTATKVLSMFRQMEQQKYDHSDSGPKPLKRFTPPPDDNRRVLEANDSDDGVSGSDDDEEYDGEEEEEQEESEEEKPAYRYEDEILKQAQAAARAKQLRAKFEKWEANEIQRELSNGTINIYEKTDENTDSQIESAKSLRAKFESMREVTNKNSPRPRVQVNRFV